MAPSHWWSKLENDSNQTENSVFSDFSLLIKPLQQNLKDKGIEKPTLVQRAVMPIVLRKKGFQQGLAILNQFKDYDLMARAQTGTGKTGAFLWPIIHLLERGKARWDQGVGKIAAPHVQFWLFSNFYGFLKVIVLSPTRELAQQLFDAAATYTRGRSWNLGEKAKLFFRHFGQSSLLIRWNGRLGNGEGDGEWMRHSSVHNGPNCAFAHVEEG